MPRLGRIDPNYKEIHNAKRPTQHGRRPSRESREIPPRRCRASWQEQSRSRASTFRRSAAAFNERIHQIRRSCQEVAEPPLGATLWGQGQLLNAEQALTVTVV